MPRFDDDTDLDQYKIGNFGFSARPIDDKMASDGYTLATLAFDISSSTSGFTDPMEQALKNSILALRDHPLSDSMMVRLLVFGSKCQEVHGFKLLSEINLDDYTGILTATGMTALFDANVNAAEGAVNFADVLRKDGYGVNGIQICCTDGCNNAGKFFGEYGRSEYQDHVKQVRQAFQQTTRKELLESYITILIAVGMDPSDPYHQNVKQVLEAFHQDAGFTQPIIPLNSDPKTIARIGQFISASVSSQSQARGTGGPSMAVKW